MAIFWAMCTPASAHYPGADINCPETTIAPTIDGVFSAGEWDDASATPVEFLFLTDENLTGIFYTKYDASNLYAALVIDDPDDAEEADEFWMEFDEGHTGNLDYGDSGVQVNGTGACEFWFFGSGGYDWVLGDFWYNGSDWINDTIDTCDFSAAGSITDDTHVWELAIPFDLGDVQDLDITPTPGKTIGLNLQYFDNTTYWQYGGGGYWSQDWGYDDWPDEFVEDYYPYFDPSLWANLTFGAAAVPTAAAPTLTPIGLIALAGLLSAIAVVALVRKRR